MVNCCAEESTKQEKCDIIHIKIPLILCYEVGCSLMSLGYGGRADKSGNVYEDHFFAKLLLDLLLERLISI